MFVPREYFKYFLSVAVHTLQTSDRHTHARSSLRDEIAHLITETSVEPSHKIHHIVLHDKSGAR